MYVGCQNRIKYPLITLPQQNYMQVGVRATHTQVRKRERGREKRKIANGGAKCIGFVWLCFAFPCLSLPCLVGSIYIYYCVGWKMRRERNFIVSYALQIRPYTNIMYLFTFWSKNLNLSSHTHTIYNRLLPFSVHIDTQTHPQPTQSELCTQFLVEGRN